MSITKSTIARAMKFSPAPSYLSKALYTLTLSSCNEKIRLINSLWVIINPSLNALRQRIFLKNRNIKIWMPEAENHQAFQVTERRGERRLEMTLQKTGCYGCYSIQHGGRYGFFKKPFLQRDSRAIRE